MVEGGWGEVGGEVSDVLGLGCFLAAAFMFMDRITQGFIINPAIFSLKKNSLESCTEFSLSTALLSNLTPYHVKGQ